MSAIDDLRALRNAAGVEPLGEGRYAVQLSEYYTAVDHPNGGYLQCVLGNAALAAATEQGAHHLHVTAITTNFIASPSLGAAELRTEVRRVGRGVSFVHVTLIQDTVVTTESLVTLGILSDDSVARYMDASPPLLAPLDDCVESLDSEEVNIRRVVDLRMDASSVRWWDGERSERGEVRGWMRLNDGDSAWSAWSLLFASDAIPPATFALGSSGWVPTLQLTTYVRRIPTSDWLRFRQWCVVIADGIVDERCEIFDDRDELVASASQIAMVRFPGGH
jgi:acyl-CoA thioesterase